MHRQYKNHKYQITVNNIKVIILVCNFTDAEHKKGASLI